MNGSVRTSWFWIDGLNPEPWTAPEFSTGRKNNKVYTQARKNPGLAAYQAAVKEDLEYNYPNVEMFTEPALLIEFYLWRQLPVYKSNERNVQKHVADATNMQKALEDAIQGVLIDNDRAVTDIHTVVVAQGPEIEPQILIKVSTMFPQRPWLLQKVADLRERSRRRRAKPAESDPSRPGAGDVF